MNETELAINLTESTEMEVLYQDEVYLDIEAPLVFIKSGEQEIKDYVDNVAKPDIDKYVVTVVQPKLDAEVKRAKGYADQAKATVDGFDAHVEDAKTILDQHTMVKIDDLDAHSMELEIKADDNASKRTSDFNNNADIRQNEINASVNDAKRYAKDAELSKISAKASEEECKRLVETLGVIFVYKGSVDKYEDLPTVGNANGDVYRVLDQSLFYVWVDTEWQNLGSLIDLSTLVTINTDQEIDAHKTFLKDMGITSKNIDTVIDRNKRLQGLGYYDKNGLRGAVYPYVGASGNVELRLMASTGGASSFGAMGVTADGNPYMYAPKPPKESDDNSVATTDWVNEKDSEVARISNGLLTGNVSTNAEGYADVLKMNSSVAEHKYDVIESSIDTDDEGWHTGELTAVDIDVTKQFKFSIGFRVTGFPHEQGLFNFVSEDGDPNSCLVIDKDQKIKCRFTTTKQRHLEEINYIINPNYEYRVTWEYDKYVGYTINIYDGATLVKSQIINDTDPIDGISPRTLQFGIGYNSGTKLEGQLKGDFIQAYSEDKLVYAPHLAIHYRLSTYGTKIADVEYRDVVLALYALKNSAPYFTIDTANRNYTLPMGNIYGGLGGTANSGGSGSVIGDIHYTSRTTVPEGGAWCDGSEITEAQNAKFYKMLVDGEIQSVTYAEYANQISANGYCELCALDTSAKAFKVPTKPNIVINKDGTVRIKGNGITLGLTDGTNNEGLTRSGSNTKQLLSYPTGYGIKVGTASSGEPTKIPAQVGIGITTDSSKSGMVADTSVSEYKAYIVVSNKSDTTIDIKHEVQLNNPFFFGMYHFFESDPNNASWLISNGNFHSGDTYKGFYQWLVSAQATPIEGISVKLSTEAYTDFDYVINTGASTFRLPLKVKGASGSAVKGNGITLGLTNGSSNGGLSSGGSASQMGAVPAYYGVQAGTAGGTGGGFTAKTLGITTDPDKSGIVTADDGLKLYFYVGETVQDANMILAGRALSQLANKANIDLDNLSQKGIAVIKANGVPDTADYVVDYKVNPDGSFYRKYKSGWLEQGGYVAGIRKKTIPLPRPYKNTDYVVSAQLLGSFGGQADITNVVTERTTTTVTVAGDRGYSGTMWKTEGQGA